MSERLQCWEFKKCGREVGGTNTEEDGVCPAATHWPADGINRGIAAGRACWTVDGTLCPGGPKEKFCRCLECTFFRVVSEQEGRNFENGLSR